MPPKTNYFYSLSSKVMLSDLVPLLIEWDDCPLFCLGISAEIEVERFIFIPCHISINIAKFILINITGVNLNKLVNMKL